MSFLFIWQLTFSAPLSIASGCIGLSQYAGYLLPALGREILRQDLGLALPLLGSLTVSIVITPGTFLAVLQAVASRNSRVRSFRDVPAQCSEFMAGG